MGFLHLWKRACEVKPFKVHQDSFLNTAMSITGHRESDFQECRIVRKTVWAKPIYTDFWYEEELFDHTILGFFSAFFSSLKQPPTH